MSGRIIVHNLTEARAAIAAAIALDVSVTLVSPRDAAAYAGPLWFKTLIDTATADHPAAKVTAVIDCGDDAGTALGALRLGFKRIRFTGHETAQSRLADIAKDLGAVLKGGAATPALDLRDVHDPEARCRHYLSEETGG